MLDSLAIVISEMSVARIASESAEVALAFTSSANITVAENVQNFIPLTANKSGATFSLIAGGDDLATTLNFGLAIT